MRNRNPWFYRSTVPAAVSLAAMLMGQPAEAQQADLEPDAKGGAEGNGSPWGGV